MSEWLGKSRIEEQDLLDSVPSIVKHFPMLSRFYIDNQKIRLHLVLPYDVGDDFRETVTRRYGAFNPTTIREAGMAALTGWLESNREA